MTQENRQPGYYFVEWNDSPFEPAHWDGKNFTVAGSTGRFRESDFPKIMETPITPAAISALDEIVKAYGRTDLAPPEISVNVFKILTKHGLL